MNRQRCVDAGRENCPCRLGVSGKCLVCPRIGSATVDMRSCQDCGWSGSCIFTLYDQSLRRPASVRPERILEITEVKEYMEGFKVFVLHADYGFCQKASVAGAYVFLRREERNNWFDMPVSILKSEPEKNRLHLGICGNGAKSKDVLSAEVGDGFVIRGIFENALTGMGETPINGNRTEPRSEENHSNRTEQRSKENRSNLAERSSEENRSNRAERSSEETHSKPTTMIFAKGIAIAPLRNLIDDARTGIDRENIRMYLDLEKIGMDFFKDYFGDIPAARVHIEDFQELIPIIPGESLLKQEIIMLTSPYYADYIEKKAGKPIIRPINSNLCCGEGICGACGFDNEKGETVHRCKAR